MRIGIDALLLTTRAGYRQTGVGRYVERLCAALPDALPADELIAYVAPGVELDPRIAVRRSLNGIERPELRIAYERVALPIRARRDRLDLFHGPVNALPRALGCRTVVTIHDLALLRWPEQVDSGRYRYLRYAIGEAVRIANRVLVPSEATRQDLMDILRVPSEQIAVTPLGVEARFRPPSDTDLAAFGARVGIDRPYVLTVGTLEPRKNLVRLLRAFAALPSELPHRLVVVGPEGWRTGELHATLAALDLGGRIRFTGFVPDDDLPCWYAGADLFVLPSLYEGFGLPIVEAMACGAPVLTANVSAMPEVAGDAAMLVDPTDIDAIAAGVAMVLASPGERRRMAKAGLARARRFTWERTAALTAKAYREALT